MNQYSLKISPSALTNFFGGKKIVVRLHSQCTHGASPHSPRQVPCTCIAWTDDNAAFLHSLDHAICLRRYIREQKDVLVQCSYNFLALRTTLVCLATPNSTLSEFLGTDDLAGIQAAFTHVRVSSCVEHHYIVSIPLESYNTADHCPPDYFHCISRLQSIWRYTETNYECHAVCFGDRNRRGATHKEHVHSGSIHGNGVYFDGTSFSLLHSYTRYSGCAILDDARS